jgi:hypothetical protein
MVRCLNTLAYRLHVSRMFFIRFKAVNILGK